MPISDIPLLSMLRTKLSWHQARQRVLAENVANADTMNFRPRDLVAPNFQPTAIAVAQPVTNVALSRTEPGHIAGASSNTSPFKTDTKGRYEIRPTGNAVSLEEEMMKVAGNQMDYQAATAVYTHSLNLIKTALGKRMA